MQLQELTATTADLMEKDGASMGPLLSVKNLLWYLEKSSNTRRKRNYVVDICADLPWNRDTIVFVLGYIFQFISNLEHSDSSDIIISLDEIATFLHDKIKRIEKLEKYPSPSNTVLTKQVELSEMLVSSFFPEVVPRFFTVPKLHQLPQSDKHLYPNEIIAGFLDFLLQVLFHETNISEDKLKRWALVRKELSFLLAVLGDIPFQCTHHHEIVEETNILLAEFEMLANEAGRFVYNGVFSIHQTDSKKLHVETNAWFQKIELLNAKIKERCLKFAELPMPVISRSNVVDSFFIVHSLIEDIENLKNHSLNFNHDDAVLEQMRTLHGELTLSQSFIKVMQDNEEKEGLIQIRDLTYEAEYLITSLVVGNIHLWYLNLRLPSVIHKIKLARIELQVQTSEIKAIRAGDVKVSCPTTGNTANMDENHGFNDDITQAILNGESDHMKILENVYKQLPCNIKPCFLYFAGFPKDFEISKKKLTWLWTAEGFIQKEGKKSVEETAEMYLLDLINRKLVLIAKRGSNGGIKYCTIQSVLYEFCVRKANDENFIKQLTNSGFSMYERCQRLCVPSTESCNYWRPFGLHCRSYRDLRKQQLSSFFQTMALLKVFESSEHYSSPPHPSLAFPAQLRYLYVANHLSDEMVANLVNLEFIYANSMKKVYVPSVVLRMLKLRHLVVWKAKFGEDWCSNMTETTNLRTLSSVEIIEKKDEDILRCCCPHLHKLKCSLTKDGSKFPDLSFLAELESLELYFKNGLDTKILSAKINFPLTIKKLSLVRSDLPWEMMSILGRLPNLNVLKGFDAFVGDVWVTRDGEFQKLKCLKLDVCRSLRLWISCSQHFPVLECLMLDRYEALVEISSDFANIRTLQRIEVTRCTNEAYLSALLIGKQIQVYIAAENGQSQTKKDELILELTSPSHSKLRNMLSFMEEYFEAGGSQGFINKLPIITDQTEDKKIGEFVLRDVLSYMEQYFPVEESIKKLTLTDQTEDDGTKDADAFVLGHTEDATTTTNDDDEQRIFCNHQTYFVVVSYAMQFSSNSEKLAIMGLWHIAELHNTRKKFLSGHPCYLDEIKKSRTEFSDTFVNSFIPHMRRFFLFNNDDKYLKKNEIVAGFMDFLLQMLSCEVNTDSAEAVKYGLLQKELSFLLAVLGDIPFQPTDHLEFNNQLSNLSTEFELFANKAGGFLYSCVFSIHPMTVRRFHAETNALLEMTKLLNEKIKEHCSNFLELSVSAIVKTSVVDSFFIVNSLIEDLENIIRNCKLGSFTPDDAMKEHMKTLHNELTVISQNFIKVVRDNDNNEIKEGLIQIRDLTYEAEYLINSVVAGNIHAWYLNLRLPSVICKMKLACSGLQQILTSKVIKASDEKVLFPTMGNSATMGENQYLDFNHDMTQRMLNDLTGISNTSRQIITIFGMPGLGKTTEATHLYNSQAALNHFDRRAWCVVSEKYHVRALFIQILLDLSYEPDKNRKWEEKADSELGEEIHKTLKGRRYFIVLDDVWHSDVLDKLRRYFPDDRNGSRVMITTRNKDVSPSNSTLYELQFLSEDQCWNLLERRVFPDGPCPSQLVSIGKRIAARCSGVPLAVVSIAGILLNVEKEVSEWERVEERLETMLLDDQSDYRKIMELSYQHLPHNIKPCFLYFARFPEDTEISAKELTMFWIALGFIQKDENKSPEEIAEMYLLDLINRSLVMTAERRSAGGTKTCRIHDLLHDICTKIADEENFLKSTNLFSTYDKHQHLCRSSSSNTSWRPFGFHCRSFRGHTETLSGFRTMSIMKVVDLLPKEKYSPYEYNRQRVDLPFQLKYLGIYREVIRNVMWDNLVDLEVLHVRGSGFRDEIDLPSVFLIIMVKLRHLLVRHAAVFEEDCSNNISETTNLRYISRVVMEKKSDAEILRKSPHLRTLKCLCRGKITFPDLRSLVDLESLRIEYEYDFRSEILLSRASFPSTLKKLCLSLSRLPWEKMSIIGELPNLEVLKLEHFAFVGDEWETKDDQFQELRFLEIDYLNLEQWRSESCHFPSLECLVLRKCKYLEEIPSDFGYIPTLQSIKVSYKTSKDACLSAVAIEKEQHEFGNQQLQVDCINLKWTKEELMEELEE